ncbi:MAG: endolytic transglycosylase MltG, partial [Flavobacteriales bacterium]|nr:endolytic transglycosylase MltG [Flavobacteriales bacterium]
DTTLKFALGLDSVKRVLDRDNIIDSPYNTYRIVGLPPGPINMPEPRFIDAVLNAEKHDFLYFCAKEDLSGYSNFSRTYEQHLVNARRYQRALNERKIFR